MASDDQLEQHREVRISPPVVSPDGRFYWNGQGWIPLPAGGQIINPTMGSRGSWFGVVLVVAIVVVVVAIGIAIANSADGCTGGQFCVEVTSWSVGSADVKGTIVNATGQGCSDPEVSLHLWDHNGASVRDFQFGAGDLANKAKRNWSTHMVGFLFADEPVESNVTRITADVICADRH